jgi:hypothetical protein
MVEAVSELLMGQHMPALQGLSDVALHTFNGLRLKYEEVDGYPQKLAESFAGQEIVAAFRSVVSWRDFCLPQAIVIQSDGSLN